MSEVLVDTRKLIAGGDRGGDSPVGAVDLGVGSIFSSAGLVQNEIYTNIWEKELRTQTL